MTLGYPIPEDHEDEGFPQSEPVPDPPSGSHPETPAYEPLPVSEITEADRGLGHSWD